MSEELDEIERLSKGVPVWVKSIVFIIVGTAISFSTYKAVLMEWFPEMFTIEADEAMIHNEVDHLKEDVKADLLLQFQDKLEQAEKEHNTNRVTIIALNQEIKSLKEDLVIINDIVQGLDKHVKFNTFNSNNIIEFISEQANKKNECQWTYYESKTGDNWYIMKDDWYGGQSIHSVTLKTGCRAFITPFDRERIQVR